MKKRDRQDAIKQIQVEQQIVSETRQLIALFKKEFGEKNWKQYFSQNVRVELTGR